VSGTLVGSRVRRTLAGIALALGALAAIAGRPVSTGQAVDVAGLAGEIDREADHVTAIELGEWIRDRKEGLRVIDVRTDSEFEAYHVPTAERVPLAAIATLRPQAGQTLVLYSDGGAHAAQAWVLLRAAGHARVYFLRGGLLEWMDDVMNPVLGADAARARAVSSYFGGVPRVGVPDSSPNVRRDPAAAVQRARRRGC
jgi:rhodanese-related sulfurtransferase